MFCLLFFISPVAASNVHLDNTHNMSLSDPQRNVINDCKFGVDIIPVSMTSMDTTYNITFYRKDQAFIDYTVLIGTKLIIYNEKGNLNEEGILVTINPHWNSTTITRTVRGSLKIKNPDDYRIQFPSSSNKDPTWINDRVFGLDLGYKHHIFEYDEVEYWVYPRNHNALDCKTILSAELKLDRYAPINIFENYVKENVWFNVGLDPHQEISHGCLNFGRFHSIYNINDYYLQFKPNLS